MWSKFPDEYTLNYSNENVWNVDFTYFSMYLFEFDRWYILQGLSVRSGAEVLRPVAFSSCCRICPAVYQLPCILSPMPPTKLGNWHFTPLKLLCIDWMIWGVSWLNAVIMLHTTALVSDSLMLADFLLLLINLVLSSTLSTICLICLQ